MVSSYCGWNGGFWTSLTRPDRGTYPLLHPLLHSSSPALHFISRSPCGRWPCPITACSYLTPCTRRLLTSLAGWTGGDSHAAPRSSVEQDILLLNVDIPSCWYNPVSVVAGCLRLSETLLGKGGGSHSSDSNPENPCPAALHRWAESIHLCGVMAKICCDAGNNRFRESQVY